MNKKLKRICLCLTVEQFEILKEAHIKMKKELGIGVSLIKCIFLMAKVFLDIEYVATLKPKKK